MRVIPGTRRNKMTGRRVWDAAARSQDKSLGARRLPPTLRGASSAASRCRAYRARWLAGNTTDAEDVVQDAYLRAYRYFDTFQEGNIRVAIDYCSQRLRNLGEKEPLRADDVRARHVG